MRASPRQPNRGVVMVNGSASHCAPAPINRLEWPTLVGPTARRGPVNIHVTKSPGTLPPSRARPHTHQLCDPSVQLPLPELHTVSIALVRVYNDLRTSCVNATRRYIQASKSPAISSVLHVLRRARDTFGDALMVYQRKAYGKLGERARRGKRSAP